MELVELGSVCRIKNGFAFKSTEYLNEGVPLLRISNFNDGKVSVDDNTIYVDKRHLKEKENFIVEKGDILIALSGATTGKYGVYEEDFPSLLNQRIGLLKSGLSEKLNSKFFFFYLSILKKEILRNAGGAAQPNISTKTISEFKIPLPPLPTQKKIASILDEADTLRQLNKQLITKYDALTQSLFLEMFGDPVANPMGWEKKKIEDLVLKIEKINNSFKTDYIDYVDIASIDNKLNLIKETTKFKFEEKPSRAQQIINKGDVLLSTVRPNLKNIALNQNDGLIASTGFFVFRVKPEINNRFLFELLKTDSITDSFVRITSGANYPALKNSELKKYKLIIPPTHLQNQFAERVAVIEQQKQQAQNALQKSEDLFNSLLQKAFKGELVA